MNSFVADDNKPYTSCQGRISILGFSKKSKQKKKKQKKKQYNFQSFLVTSSYINYQ